ncbi:MAG: SusC/RagA family TonB-linked outer membrane protein [Bacteroidales bacterium]|nr:SusC/RagA family TonB-linked outer membrane protein [Bacteroidales bacterium]
MESNMNTIANKIFKAVVAFGLALCAGTALAQTQNLVGRVVDSNGNPVSGAVVNIAEKSQIALTNEDGSFTLPKVKTGDQIQVMCEGYFSTEVPAALDGSFVAVLDIDDDLYVHETAVPFGMRQKKYTTAATSIVTGEELTKHPVSILQNAFTATLNGVETYEWSSEPGWTETAMFIRGIHTINRYARAPLVIIDDVERDLSFLDAYPIESITILKDAAATSIYGMRGGNGVIMVKTKRGVPGRTNVSFTQEIGFQKMMYHQEIQNSWNTVLTQNQVKYLSGQSPIFTDEQIAMYKRVTDGEELPGIDKYKYFNTNWFDELYREFAPLDRTNLQVSGGSERTRYYVSFSYINQGGMYNNEYANFNEGYNTNHHLNRFNLRTNIDIQVNDFLTATLDLGGRIDDIRQSQTSVFNLTTFGAVEVLPMTPTVCPDGSMFDGTVGDNPKRLISRGLDKNRRRNLYTTVTLKADLGGITPGLGAFGTISFDSYLTFQRRQTNNQDSYRYDYDNANVTDVSQFKYARSSTYSALSNPSASLRDYFFNLNFNAGLSYKREFGDHAVDAKAYVRTYKQDVTGSVSSYRFLSLNAQANYIYAGKYILDANFSRMAHDNYAVDQRWGNFWGVSAGWLMSEEPWLKSSSLDLLKLRASYGVSGQSSTNSGRYQFQSTYATGTGYAFGYSQSTIGGYLEQRAGNPLNLWETTKMVNAGLDWDLGHRTFYGSLDAFHEWRGGMLVSRSNIPGLIGVSVANESYGKAVTYGGELVLGHQKQFGDFGYNIETQWTFNRNKIVDIDETTPDFPWLSKAGYSIRDNSEVHQIYESGYSSNMQLGGWNIYKFVQWASDESKIATSQEDAKAHPEKYPYNTASAGHQPLGTAVFQDTNNDRQIDSNDMVPETFTMIPEIVGNFNIGFNWKGFDARAIFTAYLNRSVFLSPSLPFSGWSNLATHEVVYAWGYYNDNPADERNINAKYPRPAWGSFQDVDSNRSTGTYKNDIWIRKGDYLSLRNIEIGYSLPKRLVAKANMTGVRIYATGYNLKNWAPDIPKECDPEKPMSYVWWYPKVNSFSFGINITF